jgi:hypothetical protein
MPDYTCLETIERTRLHDPCPRCTITDRVRLEVAVVDGKERFAWPGAGGFQEREVDEILTHGAAGSGDFAGFLADVFLTGAASHTRAGVETIDGRPAARYDYRVPLSRSRYRTRTGLLEATVAYHGSFWADAETFDLMRLEVRCEAFPPQLEIASAATTVNYSRVRIGENDFLLPLRMDLIVRSANGMEARNTTRFTGCRRFQGESAIFFEDRPAAAPVQPARARLVTLEAGLTIEAMLATPIDMTGSAVGDEIQAVVRKDVKKKGAILLSKGTTLHGRITRLEVHDSGARGSDSIAGSPALGRSSDGTAGAFPAYTVLAFEFSSFRFESTLGNLRVSLLDYYGVYRGADGRLVQTSARDPAITDFGENGILVFRTRLLELPKGLGLRLRTLPPD